MVKVYKSDEYEGAKIRYDLNDKGVVENAFVKTNDPEYSALVEENGKQLFSKLFASVKTNGKEISEKEY